MVLGRFAVQPFKNWLFEIFGGRRQVVCSQNCLKGKLVLCWQQFAAPAQYCTKSGQPLYAIVQVDNWMAI